jgi:hypothetical protein
MTPFFSSVSLPPTFHTSSMVRTEISTAALEFLCFNARSTIVSTSLSVGFYAAEVIFSPSTGVRRGELVLSGAENIIRFAENPA